MKIRKGFISNSSSSSFICVVCEEQFSGMDACPSDFACMECVHGHVFCEAHIDCGVEEYKKVMIKNIEKWNEKIKEDNEKVINKTAPTWAKERPLIDVSIIGNLDNIDDIRCELQDTSARCYMGEEPECICPVCSFKFIPKEDLFKYVLKLNETTEEKVIEEVKDKFKTRDEFLNFSK